MASLRLAAVLSLALAGGGCAVSGSLGGFSKQSRDEARAAYVSEEDEVVTGSVAKPASATSATTAAPAETDLVFTRMAAVELFKRGGKQMSAPWENPSSGARGTVTPIASAYTKEGHICHDFLASYVRPKGGETWLQGEVCRPKGGKTATWEVKSLRPWSRS